MQGERRIITQGMEDELPILVSVPQDGPLIVRHALLALHFEAFGCIETVERKADLLTAHDADHDGGFMVPASGSFATGASDRTAGGVGGIFSDLPMIRLAATDGRCDEPVGKPWTFGMISH